MATLKKHWPTGAYGYGISGIQKEFGLFIFSPGVTARHHTLWLCLAAAAGLLTQHRWVNKNIITNCNVGTKVVYDIEEISFLKNNYWLELYSENINVSSIKHLVTPYVI